MTTSANPYLENCCSPCCGDNGCNNKWAINIMSTNPDCLGVDTSECWVVKLEPVCPPVVVWWDNVTVDVQECEEDENCSLKYVVNADCEDEKVKACDGDETPWYLDEKLEAWHGITITSVGCDWSWDASLRISVDEDNLSLDYPPIKVEDHSKLVNVSAWWANWHTIYIVDNEEETYDNMCCIGFTDNQDFSVLIDDHWNSVVPNFMWENWHYRSIFTGNDEMATKYGLKILADWYYRLFWQLTVQNNIDNNFYFNLWRWLLKVIWDRFSSGTYLSTAKHWGYARQMLLTVWNWITITNDWVFSSWGSSWQTAEWYDWPWATYNIDCLVDLHKWDVVTIWYRPQSNMVASHRQEWTFRFVWKNDMSTEFERLFWWTLLWCYQLAPKLFQKNSSNQVYENIQQ